MYLGGIIKKYRADHNLTMEEFSKRSGLSKGYISMLEKNKHPQNKKEIAPSLETFDAGTNINADFCLKAKGDSMIGARIQDGDIVFIRKQSIVENGEIAAVIIDNEATLKRVYYEKDKNKLFLQAENPKYPPLSYEGEELDHIRILGKAIVFQSDVI